MNNMEIEKVLLVQPRSYRDIEKLAYKSEVMEQWEVKSAGNNSKREGRGSIRVRSINDRKFILTTKLYYPDGVSASEVEQDTTEEMFNVFKKICPMGSRKRRFYIKVEGMTMEVDVFYRKNGSPVEWCKIDIELERATDSIPALPFPVVGEVITNDRTPEQERFARDLFINEFQMYNVNSIHPIDIGQED